MTTLAFALAQLRSIALSRGYTDAEVNAVFDYADRRARRTNPPGEFDRKGRFYASERTSRVLSCRSPSAAWPYPEMSAARGAEHVAEVHGVEPLAVKRIARFVEPVRDLAGQTPATSAHEQALLARGVAALAKPLKPIKRPAVVPALDVAA